MSEGIDDDPESRRARGAFYTPAYIVDYIVRETVGRLVAGKTPRQAAAVRVLDPACGAGAFLIGAYQYLLDWHRDRYVAGDPEKHARGRNPRLYRCPAGEWRLTTAERKRILLNNIYGVDIDPQAVEVTRLALLLKVLEGESGETVNHQRRLVHERALPDLGGNVKCGNSLIGPDFYDDRQRNLFDEEQRRRVNAFDWRGEFAHVLKGDGEGFDAIIGNPPYRRELGYKDLLDEIVVTQFGKKYRAPRMDLWYYFVHRGLEVLRRDGMLSFIVNAYWTAGSGAEKLIRALREQAHLEEVFLLGKLKIFPKVSGQHVIIRVGKGHRSQPTTVKAVPPGATGTAQPFVVSGAPLVTFRKNAQELFVGDRIDLQPASDELLGKIERWDRLRVLGKARQGIVENPQSINRKTNQAHGNRWRVGEGVFALRREELRALRLPKKESGLLRPYHDLGDVGRYRLAPEPSLTLLYSTRDTCPDIAGYPTIREHLGRFRTIMEARRETRNGANGWWHLHWPREERVWRSSKIISVQMGARPAFAPAKDPAYVPFSMNVFVPFDTTPESLGYLCGVLNSRLLWKWYQHRAKRRGIGLEINGNVLESTPMRRIDFHNKSDRACHDRLETLVEQLVSLNRQSAAARGEHAKTAIHRQIEAADRQIDRLVYELYGLTEEEIAVVEAATANWNSTQLLANMGGVTARSVSE